MRGSFVFASAVWLSAIAAEGFPACDERFAGIDFPTVDLPSVEFVDRFGFGGNCVLPLAPGVASPAIAFAAGTVASATASINTNR